jgi:hypothetical protein
MKNILIAGIVGGIMLFVWGFLVNVVIPLHTPSLHSMPNEDAVVDLLRSTLSTPGVYVFPAMPTDNQKTSMDTYTQKYTRGPLGMIIYYPHGADPIMPSQMIIGLIISIISSFFAAWFLSRSTAAASPYLTRVIYLGMLGVFVSFFVYLSSWNWFFYPLDHTTANIADSILGWLFAGLGIAAIIKPKEEIS